MKNCNGSIAVGATDEQVIVIEACYYVTGDRVLSQCFRDGCSQTHCLQ